MSFMAKSARRKLFLFGRYSLALLPPKKWLSELGAKKGDVVTVELDKTRRRLVVRLDEPNTQSANNKRTDSKPKPSGDGWEEIPQL